ncbi:MAG: rhodanese-like domain-containing protein [Gammaproteobacteria bacterium]|nr:rhodanese-like domain-containing protein [Gammaproteobacteria bacterium]
MDQNTIPEITVTELASLKKENINFQLIDVREPSEYDIANLGGKLIPLSHLHDRIDELNPEQLTVIHCKSGGRSSRAVAFLLDQGFTNVKNLKGGITAWRNEIDPTLPI